MEQQLYSQTLRTQWTLFAAHNQGHTADDLIDRFQQGEKFHLDLAEKYQAKASAFNSAADATDYLRSRLSDIANTGNQEINDILASKKLLPEKVAEIQAVQARCNADAANASRDAVDKMMAATQKILDADGVGGDARSWARANGFNINDASPPSPISEAELKGSGTEPAGFGAGSGHGGSPGGSGPGAAPGGSAQGVAPAGYATGHGGMHPGGDAAGGFGTGLSHGSQVPTAPASPAPAPAPSFSAASGTVPSGVPGVHGAPAAMAPSGLGLGPGGQPNLAQSFASGLATGQATGPGGQAFSANALQAMETGAPQTPAGTPPVAPTVPSAGAFIAATPPVDAPPAAAPAPSAAGGAAPVAPAVMTGGSWSSAATGGPSVPSGSLPAYGSDLRPPVVAAPSVPSAPTGPVSGAPVAPSPASSPSAGGTLVSPVERSAASAAAGQAGAGSSTLANASAVSAAAGATAGAASSRAAEQQRLQRLVDAVARQEPRLSWAAGLRDDGITTLLVTDLASGWIPPHVRLPAHVTLLEPTARRHDANVVDLLGAVTVAAAHHANTYVAEPGSDEPTLSGDRPARSAAPQVDELGPTLVDAVRRRDGLPRIAQAVAAPAVRKTGVLESEIRMLRECTAEIQHAVLTAYPHHDPAAVGDWMLLAAIQALIDGHEYLAHYHLAWFQAINHRAGS
ncbi:DUF5631 domain-containing protein [Mycobacterium avium]|uniref:DUF5631 domain-containing protein n=4 Tax=Mycobacterium avium TaxID=1764 RepID=UPI001E49165E|nr:DUF5631 domain-containing protein [Mycobacterium avium]